MSKNIDLQKMIIESFLNNKMLLVSICALFAGFWFQDIVFSRKFGKILSNIPDFVGNMSKSQILTIIFPYIVANFLFYIDDYIRGKRFPVMEQSVIHNLIDKILESIKTNKTQINVNELILNLKNVLEIENLYTLIITYIVPTVIICVALLFYFFTSDIKYGIMAVTIISLLIVLSTHLETRCIDSSKEHEKSVGKLYDEIQDIMVNNDTIISFDTKNKEINKMKHVGSECANAHIKCELKSCATSFKLNSLSMGVMLLLDALAIKMYYDKIIKSEMLISICLMSYTFMQYFDSSIIKFKNLMHYVGKYSELKRYFSTFKIKDNLSELNSESTTLNVIKGNIRFTNVTPLHDDIPMKKNFNIDITGNTITGIMGEIGTGKSSIIKILAGLKNYIGDVYIDDINIKHCSHESLVDNIIYIPQHPKLFNRTIYENLAYGTSYSSSQIQDFITKYKLHKFFKKFENGIMCNVGKEGSKLSGGQRQIMALIRAIIQQKKIILLDEPTSSLDEETKKIFIDLINKMENKTIVVITHDKSILHIFDKIIKL